MSHINTRTKRTVPPFGDGPNAARFKSWEKSLHASIHKPRPPKIPFDFRGTRKRGGIQLDWSSVSGADGYQIERAASGDFADGKTVINLPNKLHTSYFDAVGATPVTYYYRIRATAGTAAQPQVSLGEFSGVISVTSIEATEAPGTTPETVTYDVVTNDESQRGTGYFEL